jgi:hypothetical protein
MPRSPRLFRESDIRRAIKATRSSGIEIGRIEIGQDGRIVVVPARDPETEPTALEQWRVKRSGQG